MLCRQVDFKGLVFVYYILKTFSFFADANHMVHVQLHAPRYVTLHNSATLLCNHSVSENNLRKIEFFKDKKKILEYEKEKASPFHLYPVDGMTIEYSTDGKTIILKDVGFTTSGRYSCEVATVTPIYAQESDEVQLQVIVPQRQDPQITFEKDVYTVGEYLEANCSSAPAYPVPHLTWLINGKEVDVTLVTLYPYRSHESNLQSSTAKLKIKVSDLHVGENGALEISCRSTIPSYPNYHKHFADIKSKTVPVEIIPATVATSSTKRLTHELVLLVMAPLLCRSRKAIPL